MKVYKKKKEKKHTNRKYNLSILKVMVIQYGHGRGLWYFCCCRRGSRVGTESN